MKFKEKDFTPENSVSWDELAEGMAGLIRGYSTIGRAKNSQATLRGLSILREAGASLSKGMIPLKQPDDLIPLFRIDAQGTAEHETNHVERLNRAKLEGEVVALRVRSTAEDDPPDELYGMVRFKPESYQKLEVIAQRENGPERVKRTLLSLFPCRDASHKDERSELDEVFVAALQGKDPRELI